MCYLVCSLRLSSQVMSLILIFSPKSLGIGGEDKMSVKQTSSCHSGFSSEKAQLIRPKFSRYGARIPAGLKSDRTRIILVNRIG